METLCFYLLWHNPGQGYSHVGSSGLPSWVRLIRLQDVVWLLLFAGVVATLPSEDQDVFSVGPLMALAVAQVIEPKIPALATKRGRIFWIALKMGLGYVFIGYTRAIFSNYWLVLLL